MIGCERPDNLAIDLQFTGLVQFGPNGIVVHDNPVVDHDDPVAKDRLIVGKPVGNQTAMTHDKVRIADFDLIQQLEDLEIRSLDFVAGCPHHDEATRIAPSLLGVMGQGLQVAR